MKNEKKHTQIRIPEELAEYIEQQSKRMQVSQNAIMVILMDLGMKAYENTKSTSFHQE